MAFFKNKLAVTIVLLSVSFLLLIGYTIKREDGSYVQNGVGVTLNSVQGIVYNAGSKIQGTFSFIFNFSKVKQENDEIKKKNNELEAELIDYKTIKSENENLRAMLNFKDKKSEYKYIGCDIIGKRSNNLLDGYIINRGKKDGIDKQMVVVTAEGLVGQVVDAQESYALVQSLSNENIAVSGLVESTRENSGIVKGYKDSNNNLLAKLYYLPLNSNIQKGDVILTSGLGRLYPEGIPIGKVIDIEEDKGKVTKNALLQPYVDFSKLEEVLVIVPPKDMKAIKY